MCLYADEIATKRERREGNYTVAWKVVTKKGAKYYSRIYSRKFLWKKGIIKSGRTSRSVTWRTRYVGYRPQVYTGIHVYLCGGDAIRACWNGNERIIKVKVSSKDLVAISSLQGQAVYTQVQWNGLVRKKPKCVGGFYKDDKFYV